MPHWTKSPPVDPHGHGLPIVRTPATRSLTAIVTSESLVGCDTHFWGGHTIPCDRPECEACNNAIPYRWHGYLTAFNPADQLHFIFEMTAQAAQTFLAYQDIHNVLRCCKFEAWRWGHRKNGRVIIKVEHSAYASHALPAAPDIPNVMAVIWRLPAQKVFVAGVNRGVPRIHADTSGNGDDDDPKSFNPSAPDAA